MLILIGLDITKLPEEPGKSFASIKK